MKKIILSSIVAASLAVSIQAEGSKYYIGIGASSMSGTHTAPYSEEFKYSYTSYYDDFSSTASGDFDADGITFKVGYKLDTSRLELSYSSFDAEGTIDFPAVVNNNSYSTYTYNSASANFDEEFYGFDLDWVKPFTENSLKPYISLGVGYYSWKDYTVISSSGSSTRDRSGLSYNLGVGLLYSVGTIELDIAYKWKQISWEDVSTELYTSGVNYATRTYSDEETEIDGLYLGMNIHF